MCPATGMIFLNTYSPDIPLYVQGGDIVWSREGTCQGDPLAMAFYALATMPLIKQLSIDCPGTGSLWYADNAAAGDKCESLHALWESLAANGPDYGYFPNASKRILLVKPSAEQETRRIFAETGVQIRTDGVRYLGGCIGTPEFTSEYVSTLIEDWSGLVERLSRIATTQPQAAYQ